MKIEPLNDWAVIRPSEAEARTAGGIYIPETAKEKPSEGIVLSIGPGAFEEEKRSVKKKEGKKERKFIPSTVKPGERVLYERYAGREMTVDGEDVVLVREVNILGTLPPVPSRPKEDLPPLMLPAATASASSGTLAKRGTSAVTVKKEAAKSAASKSKKTAAKPKKAAAKKSASKKAKKKR